MLVFREKQLAVHPAKIADAKAAPQTALEQDLRAHGIVDVFGCIEMGGAENGLEGRGNGFAANQHLLSFREVRHGLQMVHAAFLRLGFEELE